MWYNQTISFWIGVVSILVMAFLLVILTSLSTQFAQKGKYKKALLTIHKLVAFIGIIVLVVGIVAKAVNQEFSVWYPLIMAGLMMIVIMLLQYLLISKLKYDVKLKDKAKSSDIKEKDESTSTKRFGKKQKTSSDSENESSLGSFEDKTSEDQDDNFDKFQEEDSLDVKQKGDETTSEPDSSKKEEFSDL